MPASWMTCQAQAVAARLAQADIAITTALIPGRAAPVEAPVGKQEALRQAQGERTLIS